MKDSVSLNLVPSVFVLLLACTGHAEDAGEADRARARKTVVAYLRADAKRNYDAMSALFTRDARLEYTYKWGSGHEDTVYELDLSKVKDLTGLLGEDAYEELMAGYQTLQRHGQVERVRSQSDGLTKVTAVVTEKYRYEGYEGTAKTTLDIVVRNVGREARISRLTSVTRY